MDVLDAADAPAPPKRAFLTGGGELGALMCGHDWSASPLGPPETWPTSLRTTVSLMLNSPFPMFLAWGPELAFLYNDAYRPILGDKHPHALGRRFPEVWSEIWEDVRPLVERALAGEATFHENLRLANERNGPAQDNWYTFSFSPVRDETGDIGGMFCVCQETTGQVLAEQRLIAERTELQAVMDAVPAVIWITRDRDATHIDGNAFSRRLLRTHEGANMSLTASEPAERPIGFKVLDPDGAPIPDDQLPVQRAARGEEVLDFEEEIVFDDGASVVLAGNAQPLRDEAGELRGAVATLIDITPRRQAERALRESEARFRNMADHAPVMMWVTDSEGYCTYLNRSWYEFTGQSARAAEGFGWLDAVHPEDRPRAEADFVDANATHTAFRAEYRLRRADGVYRWAIDAASPRFDDDGAWAGYVGSVIDIEERRESEERLRESEGRFRAAVDAVQGVLWTNDSSGQMLGDQPGWAALTGQSQAEYEGYGWANAVHPDDAAATVEAWNAAVAERRMFVFEHRVRRKSDGAWRRFSIRAVPLTDPDGVVREWVGVHTDVTELREAEAALRESESRFRVMAEAMPGFVWTAEPSGLLDYASPRWGEYSGDPETEIGERWANFVHEDDRPTAAAAWAGAVADGRNYEVEFRLRARNGSYRWWLARAVPSREDGVITRWIGSATDIDEIVAAREVLARSQADLERSVEQRTAELQHAQEALRQSQKLEAMGQLTGGVAHDFNNLLTPIIGGLDMLQRRGVGGERERRVIDGALQSAERARVLVQRLLAFARRQPLQPQAVNVSALVTGMADLIASTSGPKVRVAVDMAKDLPAASADANQLEMALLNLSVNARDAMPDGGALTIAAAPEAIGAGHRSGVTPGDYVRLSVADTGIGMDAATVGRAVEPFYSTKGIGKGTGLGLSMVHGLASQLGGAMAISSKVGLGTLVELWLPASRDAAAPSEAPVSAEAMAADKGIALLVDDEDLVRISTADMLAEIGYLVIDTASAEEALEILQSGAQIDAVITDHLMPGMTGVDLARAINEGWPGTPVLIISGYADSEGIAPDIPRLSKPFRTDDLAASLAALLTPDGG